MYEFIKGKIAELNPAYVIVETNDVASKHIHHIRMISVKQYTQHNYSYFDDFCFYFYDGPDPPTPMKVKTWGGLKKLY